MSLSRRSVLKIGAAMAAVPLIVDLTVKRSGEKQFTTGWPDLDSSLNGSIRTGSVLAVVGPRGSGKSAFMLRLAKANGIIDSYTMNVGSSDMLSIMEREDGSFIGSLMLNASEPVTDKERGDLTAAGRDAFLLRWFSRTRDVMHDSGGLMAISVCEPIDDLANSKWSKLPDYIVTLHKSTPTVFKCL